METGEIQNLEAKTIAIVEWLNLDSVPSAQNVDPDNKIGLQGAFRKVDGVYPDPIPAAVLEKAKRDSTTTSIPLLESQKIGEKVIRKFAQQKTPTGVSLHPIQITAGGTYVPLFKEQVYAASQFLAKLGFEPENKTTGGSFVLGGQERVKGYSTKDSQIDVIVERSGPNENSPTTKIKLQIKPSK